MAGESILLFLVNNEPWCLAYADVTALSCVNRALAEVARGFWRRVLPYRLFYRLVYRCLAVPVRGQHFGENTWTDVVNSVPPGLSTWTLQHWSVYYAYWYQQADKSAWLRTLKCSQNGTESKVSLLLFSDGLIKQLPNNNGTLSVHTNEQVHMMTVAKCTKYNPTHTMYSVVPGHQACDWNLFLHLLPCMSRVVQSVAPFDVRAQQVVYKLMDTLRL